MKIEIEKKVLLNENQMDCLRKTSIFLRKEKISDTYFDNDRFELTLSNKWLRQRMNNFELKIGPNSNNPSIDQYKEITDEIEIKKFLNFDVSLPIIKSLKMKNINPFCSFITYREKYKLDEITIDIDVADFGDFKYSVGEFEILVSNKQEIAKAREKIEKKLLDLNIVSDKPILAKLSYYLSKKRPEHYLKLIEAKVIRI